METNEKTIRSSRKMMNLKRGKCHPILFYGRHKMARKMTPTYKSRLELCRFYCFRALAKSHETADLETSKLTLNSSFYVFAIFSDFYRTYFHLIHKKVNLE